jgi:hypothetical protein
MSYNHFLGMARCSMLVQPAILCLPHEMLARLARVEIELPDIIPLVPPLPHQSAVPSHLQGTNTIRIHARDVHLSLSIWMDWTRVSFLVAVMAAIVEITPHPLPAPHYPNLRVVSPTRKMAAAAEQAFSVAVDGLAADTVLTPRPSRSLTNMDTTQCLT